MQYLAAVGVHGDTLATLCDMYWDVRARPKVGGRLGPAFASTSGVRQGDPLSPLLFGMYIDRVEKYLAARAPGAGADLEGWPRLLQVLLFADDLALCSHSEEGLQTLLDALHTFCISHHLRVNVPKTKVVVFGRKKYAPRQPRTWLYAGHPNPNASETPPLGVCCVCLRLR